MEFTALKKYLPLLTSLPDNFNESEQNKLLPYRQILFDLYPRIEYRPAAVLVLLYPKKGQTHTVLIERPRYDGVHSGQIAFPGGKKEKEDKNLYATALREASEELHIFPEKVHLIRALKPVKIPVSAYEVTPFLAYTEITPSFIPQPGEVENILEIPLSYLISQPWKTGTKTYKNIPYTIYYIPFGNHKIWGATAMVIAEIRDLFNRIISNI